MIRNDKGLRGSKLQDKGVIIRKIRVLKNFYASFSWLLMRL
jgi:hypothetical protein